MAKRFNRFDPVSKRTFDEAERHYVEIHHRYAREMYRYGGPAVQKYITNRALRQYDVNGEFDQSPTAWRWVIHEEIDGLEAANEWLPEWARDMIWRDHLNCIRNIRVREVEPDVDIDRRSGQMTFVKYVFEYHRRGDTGLEACESYYQSEHLPTLERALAEAFGFRRFVSNRVTRVGETVPFEEEGQIITGNYLPSSPTHRIEEYWFDNFAWAGEFFRRDEIRRLVHSSPYGETEGYLVEERCGVDKT